MKNVKKKYKKNVNVYANLQRKSISPMQPSNSFYI